MGFLCIYEKKEELLDMKTAILVDGAFFQKSGYNIGGEKTPKEEADWLIAYCHRHSCPCLCAMGFKLAYS